MIRQLNLLSQPKNMKRKDKKEKAKKRYEKAQKLLLVSNKKNLIKQTL
jgi:hypothetical protein